MRCLIRTLLVLSVLSVPASAEIVDIDSEALQRLLDSGVPLIDVRTAGEWQDTGVIEGSYLLSFFDERGRFDAAVWLEQLERIVGPGEPFALICATGGRTFAISRFLDRQVGYDRIYHANRGIVDWLRQGREVIPVSAAVAERAPERPCGPSRGGTVAGAC